MTSPPAQSSTPEQEETTAIADNVQLTPRSKVRALMADLDNDDEESDGDIESGHGHRSALASVRAALSKDSVEAPALGVNNNETADDAHNASNERNEDNDEDEDEIVAPRPRGKLARRMLANASEGSTSKDNDEGGSSAYERVRRQLTHGSKDEDIVEEREKEIAPSSSSLGGVHQTRSPQTPQRGRTARTSPGLFISPGGNSVNDASDEGLDRDMSGSDDELPQKPLENQRFLALVEKKRSERKIREAEETRKQEERARRAEKEERARKKDVVAAENESDPNSDAEKHLTQQARPTRKASKKAIEDMNRETQRISRNMQLAHQARTRKKISKQSLFDRFNFKPANAEPIPPKDALAAPGNSSSAAPSDNEVPHSTPPTSPPSSDHEKVVGKAALEKTPGSALTTPPEDEKTLPEFQDIFLVNNDIGSKEDLASSGENGPKVDKGKGKDMSMMNDAQETPTISRSTPKPDLRARLQARWKKKNRQASDDSDEDLEITSTRKLKGGALWDRMPKKQLVENRSLYSLRMLANLTSTEGGKYGKQSSMSLAGLQAQLQQQARRQAAQERANRIQQLRDRGIDVQTTEEKVKHAAAEEDLLAKAREEAERIWKHEKAAEKKRSDREKVAAGQTISSDEDEDYEEDDEDNDEEATGSDGEDDVETEARPDFDDSNEEEEESEEARKESDNAVESIVSEHKAILDEEAAESHTSSPTSDKDLKSAEVTKESEDVDAQPASQLTPAPIQKRRRRKNVVADDEDEDVLALSSRGPPSAFKTPISARKPPIPGLPTSDPPPLGLTQIFAGTMIDSESPTAQRQGPGSGQASGTLRTSMDFSQGPEFHSPIEPKARINISTPEETIQDSQTKRPSVDSISFGDARPEIQRPSPLRDTTFSATQYSDFPEPSQDMGFAKTTPLGDRFAQPPPSTVDTVLLDDTPSTLLAREASLSAKKSNKGRLRRRIQVQTFSDEENEDEDADEEDGAEELNDVFDAMKKASKKKRAVDDFTKDKSKAKEMVEELAEESEDEYAGLGGASDDGGVDDEEDAEAMREMMDDETQNVDEREIAAFYANKERADDEKQVNQLFKDITTGMLRRKRGNDYELSDSDDDQEARQRAKRREFAKMRKALLEDENVGKIAENPKKQAFFRAIEDRDERIEGRLDFLDQEEEEQEVIEDSQPPNAEQREDDELGDVPSEQNEVPNSPSKRKREAVADEDEESRLLRDMKHRRNAIPRGTRKPTTMLEVRESLSTLIDGQNRGWSGMASESESGSDREDENCSVRDPENPARKPTEVINRLTLKREASSLSNSSSVSSGGDMSSRRGTRQAFHRSNTSSGAKGAGFRVPSLLHRATTTAATASHPKHESVKVGAMAACAGGARSSVNSFARRHEQSNARAALVKEDRRRVGKIAKMGRDRKGVLHGLVGSGNSSAW